MNNIRKKFQLDTIHSSRIIGSKITIAILDSGLYPHQDFVGRIIHFKDFINNKTTVYDDNSHGTHVCGIIGGNGLMSNGIYKGVAPGCNLLPIKVLNSQGTGSPDVILDGIQWIMQNMDKYQIKIVNISIGTKVSSCKDEESALVKAVDAMWDLGITVITSAGNYGPDYTTITTPGISRKVITVGASEALITQDAHGKAFTSYSGKGPTPCKIPKPDITAPGSHIISCSTYKNGYISKSGTSMSTPIVSGAAALAYSLNPYLTNTEFKENLCLCATDLGLDRYTQGCGELNIQKLLLLCNP